MEAKSRLMLDILWFYPVYAALYLHTLLPLRFQMLLSGPLYFLIYRIAGYRKKTVYSNLERAFPEKTKKEIDRIAKDYYRHFCDYILESLAATRMSEKEARLRFTYKNPEVIHALYARKKSILLTFGHVGNWEWLNNLPLHFPYRIMAMYKPLKNRHVDRMFIRMRERFGLETIPMATSLRAIMDHERNGVLTLTLVLIDQRPPIHQVEYWLPFLHQDTPVLLGTEKISKKLDFAVVFMHIRKTARNCYEGEFVEITETPAETAPREITEATFRELEKNIREQPWSWLWSHKRWKFDRAGIAAWQTENKKNPSDKK